MSLGLVGTKRGMTRIFQEDGRAIPVTVIEVATNYVTQLKNDEVDGYNAVQITTGARKRKHLNKAEVGHYKKADIEAGRDLWEFRVDAKFLEHIKLGSEYTVELYKAGEYVDVTGISKGKGFAGAIKRHNFRSQDKTHGNSLSHRAPGSIGQNQSPGRVFKGKKMAGQLGDKRCTVQNLEVIRVDGEKNLIFIKGAVPGANGADILVKPAVKKHTSDDK